MIPDTAVLFRTLVELCQTVELKRTSWSGLHLLEFALDRVVVAGAAARATVAAGVAARSRAGLIDRLRSAAPLDDDRQARFHRLHADYEGAIRRGDGEALFAHFTRTRAIRRGIVELGQDSPAADFGRPHPDLPLEPLPLPYAHSEDG